MEILQFVFSGFWVWVGTMIACGALLEFIGKCWSRFLRHLNIRKHGWPPAHLDADGDWKPGTKQAAVSPSSGGGYFVVLPASSLCHAREIQDKVMGEGWSCDVVLANRSEMANKKV